MFIPNITGEGIATVTDYGNSYTSDQFTGSRLLEKSDIQQKTALFYGKVILFESSAIQSRRC